MCLSLSKPSIMMNVNIVSSMIHVCVCVCRLCFQHKQEEADACKRRFAQDSRSDHIALLRAFQVVAA